MLFKKEFTQGKFEPRIVEVQVPREVAEAIFQEPGDDCIWKVRSLNDVEIAELEMVARNTSPLKKQIEAASKNKNHVDVKGALSLLGLPTDTTDPYLAVKRRTLQLGSEDPKLDNNTALRLFKYFPNFATILVNEIDVATGRGAVPGKPKTSTAEKTSRSR